MIPWCTCYCSGAGELPLPHGSQAVGTLLTYSLVHHTLVLLTASLPLFRASLGIFVTWYWGWSSLCSALFWFSPWSYLLPVFEDLLRLLIYSGSFCFFSSLCYYFILLKISFLSFQWALEGKVGVDVSCVRVWSILHLKFPSYFFTLSYFLCMQEMNFLKSFTLESP